MVLLLISACICHILLALQHFICHQAIILVSKWLLHNSCNMMKTRLLFDMNLKTFNPMLQASPPLLVKMCIWLILMSLIVIFPQVKLVWSD